MLVHGARRKIPGQPVQTHRRLHRARHIVRDTAPASPPRSRSECPRCHPSPSPDCRWYSPRPARRDAPPASAIPSAPGSACAPSQTCRASPTRSASTSSTVIPASRAISPGCGVSTSVAARLRISATLQPVPANAFSASASITIGSLQSRNKSANKLRGISLRARAPAQAPPRRSFSHFSSACRPSAFPSAARFSSETAPS